MSNDDKVNINGNTLPYAPDMNLSTTLALIAPFGSCFYITGKYLGKQYTDELNTISPSANGQSGLIDSRFVINITIEQQIQMLDASLFVSVKNIFDESYISSRRPQGIKVGIPRMLVAGFDFKF